MNDEVKKALELSKKFKETGKKVGSLPNSENQKQIAKESIKKVNQNYTQEKRKEAAKKAWETKRNK